MSDPQLGLAMLGALTLLIVAGFPIAFAMLALGASFGYAAMGVDVLPLLARRTYAVLSDRTLVALPMLLFLALLLERSSVLERLCAGLRSVGRGPAQSWSLLTLVGATAYAAAASGSGVAAARLASVAYPPLFRAIPDSGVAGAQLAVAAGLGLAFAPSLLVVLYAVAAGISIDRLLAANLLPSLLLLAISATYLAFRAELVPTGPPARLVVRDPERVWWPLSGAALAVAALPFAMTAALIAGIADLPETAALATIVGLAIWLVCSPRRMATLCEVVILTGRNTARVGWLLVGSSIFWAVFAFLGGQVAWKSLVADLQLSPVTFLLLAQLSIYALASLMHWPEVVVITVPVLLPLLEHFGIDPLFFGPLVTLSIQAALLAPPGGRAAIAVAIAARPRLGELAVFGGLLPYLLFILSVAALLYIVPATALWLPRLLAH